MKNLYALNSDSKIVHIKEVKRNNKEKFYCINCRSELIAKKGTIRKHHFSHKKIKNCSFETYLHKLGKQMFFDRYKNALKNKKPFFLQYKTIKTCTACKKIPEINKECKFKEEVNKFDLTKKFNRIEMEKGVDGYIADILLSSTESNEKILIEIAVSHLSSKEKINSGKRIIEFIIENENDLLILKNNIIYADFYKIKYFNFKKQIIKKDLYNPNLCTKKLNIFKILKNGKAIRKREPIKKVIHEIKQKEKYLQYLIISPEETNLNKSNNSESALSYINLIKEASLNGIKVKNCYACRYSIWNENHYFQTSIMCRKLKKGIENSNLAAENCKNFWRIKSKETYPSNFKNNNNYNNWRY